MIKKENLKLILKIKTNKKLEQLIKKIQFPRSKGAAKPGKENSAQARKNDRGVFIYHENAKSLQRI